MTLMIREVSNEIKGRGDVQAREGGRGRERGRERQTERQTERQAHG